MENHQETRTSIRTWAQDDRPREKMVLKGASALSDAELLAILIGTGTKKESALDLARRILSDCGHSLAQLGRLTLLDFQRYAGMGQAKSVTLLAALELSRRRRKSEAVPKPSVTASIEAYEYFASVIGDLMHEEFWAMYLTRNNGVIATERLGEGGLHATIVDPKKLFARALGHHAASIIVAHNHPSGNLQPSPEDRKITRKLYVTGKHMDLPVLDHLIIGQSGYFSFADEGILDAE